MSIYIKKNVSPVKKVREFLSKPFQSDKAINFIKLKFDSFDGSSRIPFGGNVLGEYVINPSPEKFEKYLSEELNSILDNTPECIDGQNGNIFDNIIDDWANIAKCSIEEQKSIRKMAFDVVCETRTANLQQAKDYLETEKALLAEVDNVLLDLQKKTNERKEKK